MGTKTPSKTKLDPRATDPVSLPFVGPTKLALPDGVREFLTSWRGGLLDRCFASVFVPGVDVKLKGVQVALLIP